MACAESAALCEPALVGKLQQQLLDVGNAAAGGIERMTSREGFDLVMELRVGQAFERTLQFGEKVSRFDMSVGRELDSAQPLAERSELGARAQRAARGSDQSFEFAVYAVVPPDRLRQRLLGGELQSTVQARVTLAQAPAAIEQYAANMTRGKVLILPQARLNAAGSAAPSPTPDT